jgi:hypothetical protein
MCFGGYGGLGGMWMMVLQLRSSVTFQSGGLIGKAGWNEDGYCLGMEIRLSTESRSSITYGPSVPE